MANARDTLQSTSDVVQTDDDDHRPARKKLSPKLRFEVFKRDSFKCQYCGRCAPDVVLEIDHIEAHAKGGSDDILNLVTSCKECNGGKGVRALGDHTVLAKQRTQLEELQERREQLEMMIQWRNTNEDIVTDAFCELWRRRSKGLKLSEAGFSGARNLIRRFGIERALLALDQAFDQVLEFRGSKATRASADRALRFAFVLAEPENIQALYRIRARVRARWNNAHDGMAIALLRKVHRAGVSIEEIDDVCTKLMGEKQTSFLWWKDEMEDWIAEIVRAGI